MQTITVILSPHNENEEIRTLEDLMGFLINELENADIGALLKIEDLQPVTRKD